MGILFKYSVLYLVYCVLFLIVQLSIYTLLPQFHMTSFISKFVRLHGVLLFQNKHICLAIYGPQCESLMSHERMNEAETLYFHSKLPDPARGTNSEHLGNVFVFVRA